MGFSFLPLYFVFNSFVIVVVESCARLPWIHQSAAWSRLLPKRLRSKAEEKECEQNWANKWKFEREWMGKGGRAGKKMKYSAPNTRNTHTDFKCSIEKTLAESMSIEKRIENETVVQFYSSQVRTISHALSMPWSSRNNFLFMAVYEPEYPNLVLHTVWINALRLGSDEMNYWKYLCYLLCVFFFLFSKGGCDLFRFSFSDIYDISMFKCSSMFPFSAQVKAIFFFLLSLFRSFTRRIAGTFHR